MQKTYVGVIIAMFAEGFGSLQQRCLLILLSHRCGSPKGSEDVKGAE